MINTAAQVRLSLSGAKLIIRLLSFINPISYNSLVSNLAQPTELLFGSDMLSQCITGPLPAAAGLMFGKSKNKWASE